MTEHTSVELQHCGDDFERLSQRRSFYQRQRGERFNQRKVAGLSRRRNRHVCPKVHRSRTCSRGLKREMRWHWLLIRKSSRVGSVEGYDGVEVYNVYTNSRSINAFVMFFDASLVLSQLSRSVVRQFLCAATASLKFVGRCDLHRAASDL